MNAKSNAAIGDSLKAIALRKYASKIDSLQSKKNQNEAKEIPPADTVKPAKATVIRLLSIRLITI